MSLVFDLDDVSVTEFGVGRDDGSGQTFVTVPVDAGVQAVLQEMAKDTWKALQEDENGPATYQASEKHGGTEYLSLPLTDNLATSMRELHHAAGISIDSAALSDPSDVFCYFARFVDKKKRRLTAVRRATQFKGVLKSRNRLVRVLDDTLKVIEDSVFRLDNDFDLLIDGTDIHILRPSAFEFIGKLQPAILEAVPENIKAIQKSLGFVEFSGIETYACTHPRAARYLASIRAQEETKNIDKSLLKKLCKQTGVEVSISKGQVVVAEGYEMDFLEVLDRRRYEVNLVKDKPEHYRAMSRRMVGDEPVHAKTVQKVVA